MDWYRWEICDYCGAELKGDILQFTYNRPDGDSNILCDSCKKLEMEADREEEQAHGRYPRHRGTRT